MGLAEGDDQTLQLLDGAGKAGTEPAGPADPPEAGGEVGNQGIENLGQRPRKVAHRVRRRRRGVGVGAGWGWRHVHFMFLQRCGYRCKRK